VRLDALREAPYAFGSTYEREKDFDEANWRARILRRATFVADFDGAVAGTVATGDYEDVNGAAALIAMWVDPRSRRRGVGDRLVKTVIGWAAERGYGDLYLWVTAVNSAAERLYARNGFVRTGASQDVRPGELEYEMSRSLR
jgi:GNAT superfamily N-acetyltransferase